MERPSLSLAMQRLERQLRTLLRSADMDLLNSDEKKAVASMRRLALDARLGIRDYELSDTREEQARCAIDARRQVMRLEKSIVAVSLLFSPADVAQMGAQLQQISGGIV